jgi:enoyl-CoA hydratase/carnithine racemase
MTGALVNLLRLGMATAVFPRDEVVEVARARADELASHDPQSLAATKRLVHELAGLESAADSLRRAATLATAERTARSHSLQRHLHRGEKPRA